ncbi:MAG TPA: hypothetical protein VMX36_07685 [Sedimentisphaerales bacterium]|nr:hypothetical protein [Sedimentisphaerales bacterium]
MRAKNTQTEHKARNVVEGQLRSRNCELISYIAPDAPATRRPATEQGSFLRPEIGFTPKWYHDSIAVSFDQRWHTDPAYRKGAVIGIINVQRVENISEKSIKTAEKLSLAAATEQLS